MDMKKRETRDKLWMNGFLGFLGSLDLKLSNYIFLGICFISVSSHSLLISNI